MLHITLQTMQGHPLDLPVQKTLQQSRAFLCGLAVDCGVGQDLAQIAVQSALEVLHGPVLWLDLIEKTIESERERSQECR